MTCFTPLSAYRAQGGGITFARSQSWSGLPGVNLPCGQCRGCRLEKSRQWATRCMHESQLHDQNCFITLTYDEEHLPEDKSLNVTHWQLFAKRLRKQVGPFRFYHCGEYGDENQRPHYHACIFGMDFTGDREIWQHQDHPIYISSKLSEVWGKGFCTISDLTWQSAAYTARYVIKKVNGQQAEEHYIRVNDEGDAWQVKPEYSTMSRRPGIGAKWIQKYKKDVYPGDYVVNDKYRKMRPPKYYDQFLTEEETINIKAKRKAAAQIHGYDLTPERLRVRERVSAAQTRTLKRDL